MEGTSTDADSSTNKSRNSDETIVSRWLKEIELARDTQRQRFFESAGERIMRKYRNAAQAELSTPQGPLKNAMFNILWSNVQVLEPALYSRMPKVVGERTFKDSDPVGRLAAEIAERATHFNLVTQQDHFNYSMTQSVQDRLLSGRGQVWLEYETDWEEARDENGEVIVDDAGAPVRRPKPNTERVKVSHVYFLDYLESISRNQYEVRWRARRIYKTRQECIEEFGEDIGREIQLSSVKNGRKNDNEDGTEFLKQAEISVIYDYPTKEVLWVSEGYREGPLKRLKDPYRLKDFWCCPIPLVATTTTDSTIPTPDYVIYEGLAEELNFVTKRLQGICDCVRVVGMCAASLNADIKNMFGLPDGGLKPVENWMQFMGEKGGLAQAINWFPFDNAVAAIQPLMIYQSSLKAQIDEITSMPDIVRGASDPNDPVYTQQQKARWTIIKLTKKQQDVQRFCREVISKMAEIIFEPGLFSDETIYLMAGVGQMTPEKQELFPQALQLLRDDRLRTFRIGIETDSTIAIDDDEAAARWMQYLSSMKDIIGEIAQVSQFRPELLKPIVQSALDAVRALRTGRSTEGAWEKAFDEIEQNDLAAQQNPPPPDYEMMKIQNEQAKIQVEGAKLQGSQQDAMRKDQEMAFNQWEKSQRLELDTMKVQGELNIKAEVNQIAAGQAFSRAQIDKILADLQVFQGQLDAMRLEFEKEDRSLSLQEKFMEEERLGAENELEAARLVSEHQRDMKKIESAPEAEA